MDKLERIQAILNDDDYPMDEYNLPASATIEITATTTDEHTRATIGITDLELKSISQGYDDCSVSLHYSINLLASRELVLALQKALELTDDELKKYGTQYREKNNGS